MIGGTIWLKRKEKQKRKLEERRRDKN